MKDPSHVVKGKVQETIRGSRLPGPLKRIAKFGASALATRVATPSRVAQKMCTKMPKKMMNRMKGNGLDVHVEPIFREGRCSVQHKIHSSLLACSFLYCDSINILSSSCSMTTVLGPYFVLKLDVLEVATENLAQTALREKLGCDESNIPTWIKRFENLMSEKRQENLRKEVIPSFIKSKMVNEMPKMMGKKLTSKGMVADIHVEEEDRQDGFFNAKLIQVRSKMGNDPEPKLTP